MLIVGFVVLIKSADWLVDGASALAKRFGISPLVIGLTVVSFGTSAPELAVNVFASVNGSTELAIGNILGSNIANILLILGVCALIYPMKIKHNTVWKEIPLSLLAAIMVGVFANDLLIDGISPSAITRTEGIALLAFFIIFLYYTFGVAKVEGEDGDVQSMSGLKSTALVIVGCIGLTLGGKWIVDSALDISSIFGLSESFVGLTILAFGTSLPELAASAMAAWRKHADLAIGNVVGSNIFNIFWVLAISSLITPVPLVQNSIIAMTVLASLLLFCFVFIGKKNVLEKWQGALFVAVYVAYIGFLVVQSAGLS